MNSIELNEVAARELLEKHREKIPCMVGMDPDKIDRLPVGIGWANLVLGICNIIDHVAYYYGIRVKVAQVKEKFGTLRFYTDGCEIDPDYYDIEEDIGGGKIYTRIRNGGTKLIRPEPCFDIKACVSQVYGAIMLAEQLSAITCEKCGVPGSRRNINYVATLCDGCNVEYARKHQELLEEQQTGIS